MKIKNYTALLRWFYHNERGAYTVMMAIMSFALLGIVALTVDGSGMLLDKARFSQGIEQAGLALMAENNYSRTNEEHEDVLRQIVTKEGLSYDEKLKEQKKERNLELIRGIVRHYYYPSTYFKDSKDIEDEYVPKCDNLKGPNGEQLKSIACEISGKFERPSWLYLGKNNGLSFAETTTINANKIYVQKNLDEIIPIDLMLVTDLSGSMNSSVDGRYGTAKITILRDVVSSIAKELLEQNNTEEGKIISKYNRIGFTSFAFGAQQQSNSAKCYLPYEIKPSITVRNNYYYDYYTTTIRYSELLSYIGKSQQRYSYATLAQFFDLFVDYDKTIDSIDSFNGKDSDYLMNFNKNSWCLGNATRINSTYIWAKKNESTDLINRFNQVQATGATLSSSGLLIGANLLTNTNPDEEAQPSKLGANTQRIILVLSDGADQLSDANSSLNITSNLINQGMCEKIKSKLDSLQDKTYLEQPTRIGFVAFGYGPSGTQKAAWEKCVGKYYYVANNKEELLESFRKIIGLVEEVGHSIYQPPSYYSN
ncbi:pilus assembly protein [Bisgaard Taxon 10/6]|nr:TadE/TadG family type IV pilus assembly protein [Exercitatus varius]MDG2957078.1 pilus assembly protein [Exercitatus varius]